MRGRRGRLSGVEAFAELRRQVGKTHLSTGKQDGQTLHQIVQFTHIARPRVLLQGSHGIRRNRHAVTLFTRQLGQKVLHQHRHIFRAGPQRRHVNRKHIEAVVEVGAETAILNALLKILVGGGNHPHVGGLRTGTAHPFKAALLQYPQQLHLHGQRHVADLIQKQCAARCQFKTATTGADGAGECALFMPEQLGLQQLRRNGTAVHRHKRPLGARRGAMNAAGNHFLASTGFTQNEDRGITARHLRHQPANRMHGRTGADDRGRIVRVLGQLHESS